jgi:hypothetical protein
MFYIIESIMVLIQKIFSLQNCLQEIAFRELKTAIKITHNFLFLIKFCTLELIGSIT